MRARSIVVASILTAIAGVVRAAPDPQVVPGVDYTAIECLRVVQTADPDASPERRQGVEYCVAYLALRTRQFRDLLGGDGAPVASRDPRALAERVVGGDVPVPVRESAPVAPPVENVDAAVPANPAPLPAMRAAPLPSLAPGAARPLKFLEGF